MKDASAKVGKEVKIDKIIMVGGPTRMPIVQKFVEDYVGKKIERGVDPMECVALGAAVQAAIITGVSHLAETFAVGDAPVGRATSSTPPRSSCSSADVAGASWR